MKKIITGWYVGIFTGSTDGSRRYFGMVHLRQKVTNTFTAGTVKIEVWRWCETGYYKLETRAILLTMTCSVKSLGSKADLCKGKAGAGGMMAMKRPVNENNVRTYLWRIWRELGTR